MPKNGAKLEMDWDDDQEATHVFDKEEEKKAAPEGSAQSLSGPEAKEADRANMDAIMSSPPPAPKSTASNAPAPPPSTLSGAFGALGQPRDKTNGSSKFKAGAPASQSMRSAPPPPPGTMRNPSTSTAPMPPPPPGQTTTAPMHMPPPGGLTSVPPGAATMPSVQPQQPQQPQPSGPPQHPSMPTPQSVAPTHASGHPSVSSAAPAAPVSAAPRSLEATHVVRAQEPSKTPMIIGLLVAVMAIVGVAVFFLMPRSGTLVVNVADSKGGVVQNLEILVDGTKRCSESPCIVHDVAAGPRQVKVTAKGYEQPAPKAVTMDKSGVTVDFQLVPSKTSAGTGFKVAATHTGVKLTVDGKDIGPLPQELRDLEAGEHKLRFAGERYAPLEKTISVAKDEIVDLGNISLKVLKGKATINLGTPGAKVYLVNGSNRKEVPQFPMAIEFDPNEKWELQATKDGFDEYKERISFDDGQAEKTFTITLSPKGSAVAAQPATTPAVAFQPTAPAAPRPVAAQPAAPAAPKEPAAPTPKAASPAAKETSGGGEAVLKINSLPASSIVLDGKPIGVTPQAHVVVTPGSHTVMFVNAEQSLKKTITVEVKAGETKAAFAKLRE